MISAVKKASQCYRLTMSRAC